MKHTEKIILIPSELTEQRKPVDSLLGTLDKEMQKLLSDKNAPPDVKLMKYNQLVGRFMRLQEKKKQPYKANIIESRIDNDVEILEDIPKSQYQKAKMLLHYIHSSPNIEITPSGQLVIDGQEIYDSNVTDIVHDLARERKNIRKHPGTIELLKALNRMNVPIESIGNKQGRQLFAAARTDIDFDWDESL